MVIKKVLNGLCCVCAKPSALRKMGEKVDDLMMMMIVIGIDLLTF